MNSITRISFISTLLGCLFSLPVSSEAQAAPYQRYLNATSCPTPRLCNIDFPNVPAGKRLEITSTSCYLRTSSDRDLYSQQLLVVAANGSFTNAVTIVPQTVDSISATGDLVWSANHTIFAFANPGQHFRAYVELKAGVIRQFACHISGQLVP